MKQEQKNKKFSFQTVIKYATVILDQYKDTKQIMFHQFQGILNEFCVAFKLINSFLGVAFSDVKQKVQIIQKNNKLFPDHPGFFSFIKMEMSKNIHIYNGDNNKDKKAPAQFKHYNSTARNLLRMMWLLTFIRVTFEGVRDASKDMSDIFCHAYDCAFGQKHSWLIRNGAKLAIKASSNRKQLIEVMIGSKYDQQKFQQINVRFLQKLIPIHETLWAFYKQNKLVDLQ